MGGGPNVASGMENVEGGDQDDLAAMLPEDSLIEGLYPDDVDWNTIDTISMDYIEENFHLCKKEEQDEEVGGASETDELKKANLKKIELLCAELSELKWQADNPIGSRERRRLVFSRKCPNGCGPRPTQTCPRCHP